jgi:hypothetical protein
VIGYSQVNRRVLCFALVLVAPVLFTSDATGAVIYTSLPDIPVFQGNSVPTKMRFDLNYDGAWDVEFHAFDDIFKVITSSTTEVFARPAAPPNMGSDLNPFIDGSIIGGDTAVDGFSWLGG